LIHFQYAVWSGKLMNTSIAKEISWKSFKLSKNIISKLLRFWCKYKKRASLGALLFRNYLCFILDFLVPHMLRR